MTFPRCPLHNTNIVTKLPEACPYTQADVHAALLRLRDRSIWDGQDDPHRTAAVDAVFSICSKCSVRLLPDAHVQFLRRKEGLNA